LDGWYAHKDKLAIAINPNSVHGRLRNTCDSWKNLNLESDAKIFLYVKVSNDFWL
jgi:hypothetical protein